MVFPLSMVPLELQRRIINQAIGNEDLRLLALLGAVYLAVVLARGGLKYLLRLYRGVVSERAIRSLRCRMQATGPASGAAPRDDAGRGETVSIITAEVERVGGFVGEAFFRARPAWRPRLRSSAG